MKPDARSPVPAEQPLYAAGAGFVVHHTGRRLTHGECEGCLAWHDAAVASSGSSRDRHDNNFAWAAQLRAAMDTSFQVNPKVHR